jgi:hypothetical protein
VFPGEPIIRASERWIELLDRSPFREATAIVGSTPGFMDLTATQYSLALELLRSTGLVEGVDGDLHLADAIVNRSDEERREQLFARLLERFEPAWLVDADIHVRTPEDVPQDAADLAAALGLTDEGTFLAVRRVHGQIDLVARAAVGQAGESALVELIEGVWPGSTTHVSLDHDGFGYDVEFRSQDGRAWHLEVKTTTRRGRLLVHLSRQEHDIGRADPRWRVVVVGLNDQHRIECLATVRRSAIFANAPADAPTGTRWESARYDLTHRALHAGLEFVDTSIVHNAILRIGSRKQPTQYAWMPNA